MISKAVRWIKKLPANWICHCFFKRSTVLLSFEVGSLCAIPESLRMLICFHKNALKTINLMIFFSHSRLKPTFESELFSIECKCSRMRPKRFPAGKNRSVKATLTKRSDSAGLQTKSSMPTMRYQWAPEGSRPLSTRFIPQGDWPPLSISVDRSSTSCTVARTRTNLFVHTFTYLRSPPCVNTWWRRLPVSRCDNSPSVYCS